MKKKIVFIFFILLQLIFRFLAPPVMALDDDNILEDTAQPEGIEELSLKIDSSLSDVPPEYLARISEIIQLINELEREILLTNLLIELREEGYAQEEIQLALEKEREKWEGEEEEIPYMEALEIIEERAPEEIITARQISVEPEKGISREEKSLLTELEERREIEKLPIAPRPSPQTDEIYSFTQITKDMLNVKIEKERIVLVPAVGLKRFMVTDPDVLKASRKDDKISIQGTALGSTFLHIWDSDGRRSVRVTVVPTWLRAFIRAQNAAIKAEEMKSFRVTYSFDRSRINSSSEQSYRSYHHTFWSHRLNTSGETPWGDIDSRLVYQGQELGGGTEMKRDLTFWSFNLKGEDLEIALGNTGGYFSRFTLPPSGFQGVSLKFKDPDPEKKRTAYDLVWGARGSRMWGYKISTWETANYFWGAKAHVEPADFIFFDTAFVHTLEEPEDIGKYVYAGVTGLNFWDNKVKILAEFARNKGQLTDVHNHAYQIDTSFDWKDYNLFLKGTYRDIDPDFVIATGGTVPHLGALGYYFDAKYNPFKYLRLTGKYNIYRERDDFNVADADKYNRDWQSTLNFRMGPYTTFNFNAWRKNHEGRSSPSHGWGQGYSISHSLKLPSPMGSMGLGFSYLPTQYRNLGNHSSDYRSKRYVCSMRLNVLKNLYYNLSHSWFRRHMLESGNLGTVKTLATGLRYSSQIFDTPFYGSFRLRYDRESDVMENLSLTAGERVVLGEAEIKYRPSGGSFESYLRYNYRHIRGVLDHTLNREETLIYGGGKFILDTTLRWGVGGSVRGYAFKDENKNGRKDRDEEGFPGIRVYAGKIYSAVTSADGEFEFKRLKDLETLVMYDIKRLPEGYKPTTGTSQKVKVERGFVKEVNFGIIAVGEISGRVFNDVNMNGIFDDDERGVGGILLTLDDGTMAQTTARGYYRMEDAKVRTQTLILDALSLPFNFMPLTDAKRTIDVKAGEYYEEDFPLYALRTIVGTVFVDRDGNNRFDPGEEGIADVILRCSDATAITDEKGRYFLKKLPGGAQDVLLDIETIPAGYELSVEPSRTVELRPQGEIKEDVNFSLIKQ